MTKMENKMQTENIKWAAIRNGRGQITGWIELFWSPALNQWVSIPGVSGFLNE
jgi:hypothetical protein